MQSFSNEPTLPTEKLTFENRFITLTFENYRQKRKESNPVLEQRITENDTPEVVVKKLTQQGDKQPRLFPSELPIEAMLILADYVLAPPTEQKIYIPNDICLQVADLLYQQAISFNKKYTGAGIINSFWATIENATHKQMREDDMKAVTITYNAIVSKLSPAQTKSPTQTEKK